MYSYLVSSLYNLPCMYVMHVSNSILTVMVPIQNHILMIGNPFITPCIYNRIYFIQGVSQAILHLQDITILLEDSKDSHYPKEKYLEISSSLLGINHCPFFTVLKDGCEMPYLCMQVQMYRQQLSLIATANNRISM